MSKKGRLRRLLQIIYWFALTLNGCFSEKCPSYCRCLIVSQLLQVDCVSQRLVNIDLDLPKQVEFLDLSNNSISYLDDREFQKTGLINLVKIIIMYNSIIHIGRDAFYGLNGLHYVNLKGNHLHKIHAEIFHGNLNLISVVLADNPLQQNLKDEPLLDSPYIQNLDISGCRFGYFTERTFERLENLRHLNVSRNNLIDLYNIEFLIAKNLTEIDITGNQIKCDEMFQSLLTQMENKSVNVIGTPCTAHFPPGNIFERLIMSEDIVSESTDEITIGFLENENFNKSDDTLVESTESVKSTDFPLVGTMDNWITQHEKYEYTKTINNINNNNNTNQTTINFLNGYNYYNFNNIVNIPQVWVFILGFQMGVIFTLALVFTIWCLCSCIKPKYNKKRLKPYQLI